MSTRSHIHPAVAHRLHVGIVPSHLIRIPEVTVSVQQLGHFTVVAVWVVHDTIEVSGVSTQGLCGDMEETRART